MPEATEAGGLSRRQQKKLQVTSSRWSKEAVAKEEEEEAEEEQEERPRKEKSKKNKQDEGALAAEEQEELPRKEKKKKKLEDEEAVLAEEEEEEQPRKSKKRAKLEDEEEVEKQLRKSKKRAKAEEADVGAQDEDDFPKSKKKAKKSESEDEEKPVVKEFKIQVRGLPKTENEEAIRKHFEMCGPVAEVNLLRRPNGRSCGTAFVSFEKKSGLQSALEGVGKVYEGTALQVNKSEGAVRKSAAGAERKAMDVGRSFEVFVGGLPYTADEESLRLDFGEHGCGQECGEIQSINLALSADGSPRGFAFITFKTQEGMRKALELNETEYNGRWLQVKVAGQGKSKGKGAEGKGKSKGGRDSAWEEQEETPVPKGKSKGKKGKDGSGGLGKGKGDGGTRAFELFVGGLPFSVDEETVRKDFMECGEMGRFSMPYHEEGEHKGAHKGLAFINYLNEESMNKALKFHETEYNGVGIRVLKADAPRNPGARS